MRGNPYPHKRDGYGQRSIPASAGQPWAYSMKVEGMLVYPRECGATH